MSFKSDSSFPEQSGEDDRPMFNGLGPEPWVCLDCPAAGKGYVKRAKHWYATEHRIVWGGDPRAKTAPRENSKPKHEQFCLPQDGTGRR